MGAAFVLFAAYNVVFAHIDIYKDWREFGQVIDHNELSLPALDQEFIDRHNSDPSRTWTAGRNKRFEGKTLKHAAALCGTLWSTRSSKLPVKTYNKVEDLPSDFDWRINAAMCPSLAEIRDQSTCGSCWAFGSVEAMTDRRCIHSRGADKSHLSAQDVTSCDHMGDMGCNGGVPETAYSYYRLEGVVTGGNYGDKTGCWSYQMPPCAHHVNSTDYPTCGDSERAPSCARKCENNATWSEDKRYGNETYNLKSVNDMMADIQAQGPITAQFFVYEDFLTYQSGVYEHKAGHGRMLGGHAIKILGWGVENGTDYWLVANSWNDEWGAEGFFKIVRGKNNCQIENFALNGGPVAGLPKM